MLSTVAPIAIEVPSAGTIFCGSAEEEPINTSSHPPMTDPSRRISLDEPSSLIFSNYDILLMPLEADEPVRFAPGNHVGNQRFKVLLGMHRHRYTQANEQGDEMSCQKIVEEVIHTVYKNCMPRGRFFEQGRNNQWQELQLVLSTFDMIKSCLESEPQDFVHCGERSPKRPRQHSIVSTSSSSEVSLPTSETTVSSANVFDIICDSSGKVVKKNCQHTGNNRFGIMVNIQTRNYKKCNRAAKKAMAKEVVSSIMDDASSRFLQDVDGQSSFESSSSYVVMSREMALVAVKKALDAATGNEKKKFRESEMEKLLARKRKKAVLGKLERRSGKSDCKTSLQLPTTFKSFQLAEPLVLAAI